MDRWIEDDKSMPPIIYRKRAGLWFARILSEKRYTGGWASLYIARRSIRQTFLI